MANDFVQRIAIGEFETARARKKVIAECRRMGATRVMLFNTYGHIEPGHLDLDETRRRADIISHASRDFRAAGLGVGVNIHVTLGMNMSPPRQVPLNAQHTVDFDGDVFTETYCPFDPGFQNYTAETYAILAAVEGIDDIWIDDDFRYKNKAGQCFCPLHLEAFAQDTGRPWTRRQVIDALRSDTLVPTDLAVKWGHVQNRALIDCAGAIADAVRRVAPHLRIGFMPPSHNVSFYGTDSVREICQRLNPNTRGLARPEYGGYSDIDRVAWGPYCPTWAMQRAVGDTYEGWPELETWPGTGFNHSARVVQMKLAWGAIHGYVSTTLSGARRDKPILKAIANAKAQITEITPFVTSPDWQTRGVSLELSENTLGLRTKADHLTLEHFAARLMTRTGLPIWPAGGCGRVLVGNSPLARADELQQFAREGMIIDRDAFAILREMNRDDIIGPANIIDNPGFPAAERYTKSDLNGKAAAQTVDLAPLAVVRHNLALYHIPDSPEFTPLCWLDDQGRQPLGISTWTRQWSGGKIAVLPFSLNEHDCEHGFLTALRKNQLETILEWLTGQPLPLRFGYGEAFDLQAVYREHRDGDRIFLGLANFGLDDANEFALHLPLLDGAAQAQIRVLDSKGKWRSAQRPVADRGRIDIRTSLGVPDQEVRAYEIIKLA